MGAVALFARFKPVADEDVENGGVMISSRKSQRIGLGHNRHWLLNIFDPDGSRTEIMEPTLQPQP